MAVSSTISYGPPIGAAGSASGDLSGTYPSPTVAAIHETSGPTKLTVGAVADGQGIKRSGSTAIGFDISSGGAGTRAWLAARAQTKTGLSQSNFGDIFEDFDTKTTAAAAGLSGWTNISAASDSALDGYNGGVRRIKGTGAYAQYWQLTSVIKLTSGWYCAWFGQCDEAMPGSGEAYAAVGFTKSDQSQIAVVGVVRSVSSTKFSAQVIGGGNGSVASTVSYANPSTVFCEMWYPAGNAGTAYLSVNNETPVAINMTTANFGTNSGRPYFNGGSDSGSAFGMLLDYAYWAYGHEFTFPF